MAPQIVKLIQEYLETGWWQFGMALEPREKDPVKRASQLKRLRIEVRKALRRTPWWVEGHLNLGMIELDLMALQHEKPSPRSVSTVRACADAVMRLMNRRSPFRKKNARRVLEAKYLLAMGFFRLGKYEEAVEVFEGILALNNAVLMDRDAYFSALEHAALASIILNDGASAEIYLGRIPHDRLSNSAQQALDLLARERSIS